MRDLRGPRDDEDEVHPGDGQEMRQPTCTKVGVVAVGEVRLAEDERARHRVGVAREGRRDAPSNIGTHPVDHRERAGSSTHGRGIHDAPGPESRAACIAGSRVRGRGVPEALDCRDLGRDLHAIAPREIAVAPI